MKNKIAIYATYCALLLILVLGLKTYRTYGISWDEPTERKTGLVSLKYVLQTFSIHSQWLSTNEAKALPALENYQDKDYGVSFQWILIAVDFLTGNMQHPQQLYASRHLYTFLFCVLGLVACYFSIIKWINDKWLALLGTLLLATLPRFTAECFYNVKDLVFLSCFSICILALFHFLDFKKYTVAILFGIITGFSLGVRLTALIIPAITLVAACVIAANSKNYRTVAIHGALYLFFSLLFFVLLWPYLWNHPVDRFAAAYQNMSHFRWNDLVLYQGIRVPASQLPWHYLFVWIAISTPIYYSILFCLGVACILYNLIRLRKRLLSLPNEQFKAGIVLALFGAPVLAVTLLHSVLYDGWRQMYFVAVPIILILVYFAHYLIQNKLKSKWVLASLALMILYNVYQIKSYYPYQQVYFSELAGSEPLAHYEGDYWGLSYKQALEQVALRDTSTSIGLVCNTYAGIQNIMSLPSQDARRFFPAASLLQANYYITENRWQSELPSVEKELFCIQVKGMKIMSVYRLKH